MDKSRNWGKRQFRRTETVEWVKDNQSPDSFLPKTLLEIVEWVDKDWIQEADVKWL